MGRMACTEPQSLYKGALYFFIFLIQAAQKYDEERVNLRKLNELEVRKEYQIKI